MAMSEDRITIGAKLFARETKTLQLLRSVPEYIDRVIIVDDGDKNADERDIYGYNWPFDLTVIDLEFDAGLGEGRSQMVNECDTEYLLIVDSDMEVPADVDELATILDNDNSLGGVAGFVREDGEATGLCHDLFEEGNVLVRDIREQKTAVNIGGNRFIPFDFVPNAAMFRMTALEDYCWDPEYVIGREHIDFYVGHWKQTAWQFGVAPDVVFPHHPGGRKTFTLNRHNDEKLERSRQYFLEKWGYKGVIGRKSWPRPMGSDRPLHPLPVSTAILPANLEVGLKRLRQRAEAVIGIG